ncbi:MAG: hypothetical protein E7515_07170 [Ruminococcaceae bacterium]|nr:hypothetical protein [Oscillospiraceae bacterium]
MNSVFLTLFNMSLTALWLVLAVVVFKLIFKKAPRFIHCLLWALVALRLLLPFSLESVLSLVPSAEVIPHDIITSDHFDVHTGFVATNSVINEYLDDHYYEGVTVSNNFGSNLTEILAIIWLAGLSALLVYAIISYLRLRLKTNEAVKTNDGYFLCDNIPTPFILGVIRPKIYIPSSVKGEDIDFILAHERAHIKRRDYLWKPLGYLLLCVYWFNPIMWLAFVLLCRDIEFACDEKVLKNEGESIKKAYSNALLNCSMPKRAVSACPLAFGETGVRKRISAVLNYKKPAFWIVLVAVISCAVIAVCFMTNPKKRITASVGDIVSDALLTPREVLVQDIAISSIITPERIGDYYIKDNTLYESRTVYFNADNCKRKSWVKLGELEDFSPIEDSLDYNTDFSVYSEFYDFRISDIIKNTLFCKRFVSDGSYLYFLYQKSGDVILCDLFKSKVSGSENDNTLHVWAVSRMKTTDGYDISQSGLSDRVWSGTKNENIPIFVKELETDGIKPHITVLWENWSDRDFGYSSSVSVYRINSDGTLSDCKKKDGGSDNAEKKITVKPDEKSEQTINLENYSFSEDGWYRICLNQGNTDKGEWWIDFTVGEVKSEIPAKKGERYETYATSEYINPYFELYDDGTFALVLSAFSDRIITGKYEYSNPKKTLLTLIDGENGDRYVFRKEEAVPPYYLFDESLSATLPKYRYSENGVPEAPFSDEADFILTED